MTEQQAIVTLVATCILAAGVVFVLGMLVGRRSRQREIDSLILLRKDDREVIKAYIYLRGAVKSHNALLTPKRVATRMQQRLAEHPLLLDWLQSVHFNGARESVNEFVELAVEQVIDEGRIPIERAASDST